MKEQKETLRNGLEALRIELDEVPQEKLLDFGAMLLAENEKQNLTAVRDPREVVSRHFLDSLAPLSVPAAKERLCVPGTRLIDVGTGAGFPGIPLAIALPELSCTLLDSLQKRIAFLENVTETLGLSNANLLSARAEDAAKDPEHREAYDLATSRAVADLAVLSEYCLPFVRVGGAFLAYKGADCAEETSLELETKGIELVYANYVDSDVVIIGDGEQLRRVMHNLIGNAIKYMDKPHGIIQLRVKDVGDFVQIEVEDNGKGIGARDLQYIFERFSMYSGERSSDINYVVIQSSDSGNRIYDSRTGEEILRTNENEYVSVMHTPVLLTIRDYYCYFRTVDGELVLKVRREVSNSD